MPLPDELVVQARQGDVGQQRRQDASHAIANFEFEAFLGRPRVKR
jgi:hypothetical protein